MTGAGHSSSQATNATAAQSAVNGIVPHLDPSKRQDAVILFDVEYGNPNGDPDAGNMPRTDPETMHGLVSDVCIKRRVRDYIEAKCGSEERTKIYVQSDEALNTKHTRAYTAHGWKPKKNPTRGEQSQVRDWMCQNYWDIRTFGAVMTTEVNTGQVRGPAQLTFARSVEPIVPYNAPIGRKAVTTEKDFADVSDVAGEGGKGKRSTFGDKWLVPYGLYVGYIFVNPVFADQTGFDSEVLTLLWEALEQGWQFDRSASRGKMACHGLFVFSHDSPLGNAPAHLLFNRISVTRKGDVATPRRFDDYEVTLDEENVPTGVTLNRVVG